MRVFIIDDEWLIAYTLELILRDNGFDATGFTVVDDLLRNLIIAKPAALITDIDMGTVNGVQLAETVSVLLPTCKILFLSGRVDGAGGPGESGCQHWPFLAKPVHTSVLLDTLNSLLSISDSGFDRNIPSTQAS